MIQQKPRTQSKRPGFIHDSSKNCAPHALRVATYDCTVDNGTSHLQATRITSCNLQFRLQCACLCSFKPHALRVATANQYNAMTHARITMCILTFSSVSHAFRLNVLQLLSRFWDGKSPEKQFNHCKFLSVHLPFARCFSMILSIFFMEMF